MRKLIALTGLCGSLAGCVTSSGITPAQVAQVACVLGADGATVVAIARPGVAIAANAGATLACDAGTQIGSILGAAK